MSARSPGFTLIEVLVVIVLLSILLVAGFTNLVGIRSKQAVINGAQQVKTAIDTARTRSLAVRKDPDDVPSAWLMTLYPDKNPPKNIRYLMAQGPYPDGLKGFDNPPNGTKIVELPARVYFGSSWSAINSNSNFGVLLGFKKLTGEPLAYRVNPNSKKVMSGGGNQYDFDSQGSLEVIVQNDLWQQSITITGTGVTEMGGVMKK